MPAKKTGSSKAQSTAESRSSEKPAVKKRPASRKTSAKKTADPGSKPVKPTAPLKPQKPDEREIAVRAYYLSETRIRYEMPGDALGDWVEAERQLHVEYGFF